PRSLGLCLQSLSNQTEKNFDVFVADDGSSNDTKRKIDQFQTFFANPIQYYWHEDHGFRKAMIHNQVFRELKNYDTAILVDGDTFQHYRFVEDHLVAHQGQSRMVFMGRRVEVGPELTSQITESNVCQFNKGLTWPLFWSQLKGDTR